MRGSSETSGIAGIVGELIQIRTKYGGEPRGQRRRLLRAASRCPIDDATDLVRYHELLLFLCAFPDDRQMLRLAVGELKRVGVAARAMTVHGRRTDTRILADSGIAGTVTHCRFSVRLATWLAEHYHRDSEIAWEDESAGAGLDAMLGALVEPTEMNGIDDVTQSTRGWFDLARGRQGRKRGSDLSWLLRQFARLDLEPRVRDKVFDLLELRIRWVLRRSGASRTFARLPWHAPHFINKPLARTLDVSSVLSEPLGKSERCDRPRAKKIIDMASSVLAVRHRETDPVTCATVDDVALFDMGAGVDIALFGMLPGHREPIETYYGYLLAKNRVPIAYGGGWIFCGRCEIGLNIFETFRGGESLNTFGQLVRLYRHHFGIERFTIDPYQIGAGNPEAIKTGAFWFYYRFGFRSQEPDVRQAADREWKRMDTDHHHRTAPRMLQRFGQYPLELELDSVQRDLLFEPVDLSLGVTRWIGERFHGDRERARSWSIQRVHRLLGPINQTRWRAAEVEAFNDFCLLIGPIADLPRWTAMEKRKLVQLMLAKGGHCESSVAVYLKRHQRLRRAWTAIVQQGGSGP